MVQNNIEKIGILIPTFNRVAYLREALDSALGQTHRAIHVIVIDNGSSDGTSAYMQTLADPRVGYVVNEKNLGPIGSINKGIALMPEDVSWCTILCDDDLLEPDYIEQMLDFMILNGLGVAYAPLTFIDAHGTHVQKGARGPERESSLSYLKARSRNRRETYLSGVFFARDLFKKIGGYPDFLTGMGTDDAFIFHLGVAGGGTIGCNGKTTAYIRRHDSAESMALTGGLSRHFQSLLEFQRYCCDVARAGGFDEKVVACWIRHKIKLWLNSELIKTIRADLAAKAARRDERPVRELRGLLDGLRGYLSMRFRMDLLLYSRFGLLLESQRWYFLLWRIISF